ncbi:TonB-dependent receptor [Novosphingobium aerophilum]|uniref:TonB-dependent receptor n=1 Tax=Novosphingobium TaxID=165696 RepID=UPI0006C85C63|nr:MULTISPECIES: TonB-dependent receptor [unclassified Novosphingobium]KPH68328.1 TonB-dependent receptor [Novosphingobium sp. ST904]MPS68676.1 TonB-dependent receptor [Novosphingobium sp.]TCM25410.1 iron complex outermembrane receptor protein [Novosphingobium sp. ST904]WRT95963.1 TonB-dependent receptor [Novosphingobium sp. RL4]
MLLKFAIATSPLALAATLLAAAPALAAEENGVPGAAPEAAAESSALADTLADSGSGEAIVVTASRRRDENVQDVPVAISVISAASLEKRGDYTLGSIQQQVPSLQVITFNPRNTNINIRGLGSNVSLTNDGLENGVGFYIDNVYYGRVGLAQFDLVDLQGIEVLRGPQGTLFGKNTTSGVINVTSKKPTFDPELSAEASIGNYGYYQVRASGSAGIFKDLLAVRLSGAISENDGFLWNKTTNRRAQDYLNKSIRGQILLTPDPDFEVRIIGDYARQKQNHVLNVFAGLHTTYADGTTIAGNFAQRAARFPGYTLPSFDAFDRVGEADSHYQSYMAGYGVSGEVNWNLGGPTLTSITAYRWWDWDPANDGDSTSLPVVVKAQQANRQRQFSQELRLASKSGGSFDYVIGGYYFWQTVRGYGATGYGSAAPLWFLGASNAVTDAALNGYEVNSYSEPQTKTLAAFGQTDWHITPSLTLTTGLRFTHEEKKGVYQQWVAQAADISGYSDAVQAQILAIRASFNKVVPLYSTSFSDNSLSGLISLSWKVAPDVLLYGSYSRGNKSGGLNLTQLPASVTDPTVKPEKVDAFEVGVKSQFLDRRATFNAAGFWTEISDYQTAITDFDPANPLVSRQYIANIPKVRSRGIEAEFNIAPTDNLSFNASGTWTDAKYVSYTNAPQAIERLNLGAVQDLSGERLPGVPKFAWNVGADFSQPLGTLGDRDLGLYAHADYAYRSNFNTSASNSAWARVPGFGLVNGRIGVKTDDGLWDFSIWAKNLFDKDYFVSLGAANTGVVTAQLGEPRTFGATLRTKF